MVSRDLFLFPVSKYKNICGLSTAWHRVKCYMHWVRRVISKLCEGKGYDLVELQRDSYDVCVFFDRLQMAFFELHDKYHPISGLEHVIKVWVEFGCQTYARFWFEGKCHVQTGTWCLIVQLCQSISYKIDTLQLWMQTLMRLGGVSCENYHFLAYGAIYWA